MAGASKNRTTANVIVEVITGLIRVHGADVVVWFGNTTPRYSSLRIVSPKFF